MKEENLLLCRSFIHSSVNIDYLNQDNGIYHYCLICTACESSEGKVSYLVCTICFNSPSWNSSTKRCIGFKLIFQSVDDPDKDINGYWRGKTVSGIFLTTSGIFFQVNWLLSVRQCHKVAYVWSRHPVKFSTNSCCICTKILVVN